MLKLKQKSKEKKKERFEFLYPFILKFLEITRLKERLLSKQDKKELLSKLNVNESPNNIVLTYYLRMIADIIMAVAIMLVLILTYAVTNNKSNLDYSNTIKRPNPGEGSATYSLNLNAGKLHEPIDFTISERQLSEEELDKVFEYSKKFLDEKVIANNESYSCVRSNLYFPNEIGNLPITLKYEPDDTNLITRKGVIANEEVSEEGVISGVNVIIKYLDKELIYRINVHIFPPIYSEKEVFLKKIQDLLVQVDNSNLMDKEILLPNSLDENELSWEEKEDNTVEKLLVFMVIVAISIKLATDYATKNSIKKRNEQLIADYPELINKLSLLINAGMPIKQAFVRISNEYQKKQEESVVKKRYLYEEIKRMCKEMEFGVSETIAYETFGRRCAGTSFLRLSTILVQNLRKGNSEIVNLLNIEATESYKERKDAIKRKGEEAGTKMLLPMAGMLIIVFVIVLVPAFMSM